MKQENRCASRAACARARFQQCFRSQPSIIQQASALLLLFVQFHSDPNLDVRPLIMFLTDAKIQVSKILTDFFFGAKNGPKINFFGEKSPNVAFVKKVGWLVGWLGLMGYFSACMLEKIYQRTPWRRHSKELRRYPPDPMNNVKIFQGRPRREAFGYWYTANTNLFILTIMVTLKSEFQLGWVIKLVPHNLVGGSYSGQYRRRPSIVLQTHEDEFE